MLNQHYDYYASNNKTGFFFESIGTQGTITKVIEFRHREAERWNLGFGDLRNGKIDDLVITNNHNVAKIIGTVAEAIFEFLGEYPEATLIIRPIDEKRKKLYNYVFQHRFKEIKPMFEVRGLIGKKPESYSTEKFYD